MCTLQKVDKEEMQEGCLFLEHSGMGYRGFQGFLASVLLIFWFSKRIILTGAGGHKQTIKKSGNFSWGPEGSRVPGSRGFQVSSVELRGFHGILEPSHILIMEQAKLPGNILSKYIEKNISSDIGNQ